MECANSHSNGDPLVGKYKGQRSADRWSGRPRSGLVVGIILNSMKLMFSSLSKSNLIAQSLANDRLSKLTNYVILFFRCNHICSSAVWWWLGWVIVLMRFIFQFQLWFPTSFSIIDQLIIILANLLPISKKTGRSWPRTVQRTLTMVKIWPYGQK